MIVLRAPGPIATYVGLFFLTSAALRGLKMLVALGALHLGANSFQVGMLAAGFAIMPLLLSLHAGRVSDRIGPRLPILGGAVAMSTALVVPILTLNMWSLFASALLLGFGQIFIQLAVHNAIGHTSTPATRARNYASLSLGVSVAAFVAPLAVGFMVDHFGYQAAFALLAVDAVAVATPLLFLKNAIGHAGNKDEPVTQKEAGSLLRHSELRRVLFMSGVAMSAMELFAFYLPIYGDMLDMSATAIGTILAFNALASVVVRFCSRLLLERYPAMTLLTASLFIAAVSFALFPLFGNIVILSAISFLLGLGLGIASPLTISQTYEVSPAGRSGEALGLRVLVNKVVQIAVPLAFGSLGTVVGMTLVFWGNTALLLVAGALGRPRT